MFQLKKREAPVSNPVFFFDSQVPINTLNFPLPSLLNPLKPLLY